MTILGCFDVIQGASLYGWAYNTADATPVVVEALTSDGRRIGLATADSFRGDLLTAGLGTGRCAFRIDLTSNLTDLLDCNVLVRSVGAAEFFIGSPKRIVLNPNYVRLFSRPKRACKMLPQLRARLNRETKGQALSIVMPVHNTREAWLIEAIESVRAQWCERWELICIDDASTYSHVGRILRSYAKTDPRIRVFTTPENVGIARSTNFALRHARHEWVTFLDHDDYLEPHAVWKLLRAARSPVVDLIYSDELITGESINRVLDVRLRPAFSHDYYLSHPYFVHMLCVRRAVAYTIGGWDEAMVISADVDFVLRVLEISRAVAHVPSVLYRWRTHAASSGHAKQDAVTAATRDAIQRHLDRIGSNASVASGVDFNQFGVTWPPAVGRTLIVIPTKNGVDLLRKCVASIERTTASELYKLVVMDHQSDDKRTLRYLRWIGKRHTVMPYAGPFNFSQMNNAAVALHQEGCRFVLFLNNDVEAIRPGWLERMASLAARPDIGAVGPAMLFTDDRIQHAGVIIGYEDAAEHVGKWLPFKTKTGGRNLGANCTLSSTRDFSAVTAACMMMPIAVFQQAGGFREVFGVAFNDTDLCLRVRALGYRVLYDGHTVLYHHESQTRIKTNDLVHPEDTRLFQDRWGHMMQGADPFYHPALTLSGSDHVLREQLVADVVQPRTVAISLRPVETEPGVWRAI